jgi:hypothetical protein
MPESKTRGQLDDLAVSSQRLQLCLDPLRVGMHGQ